MSRSGYVETWLNKLGHCRLLACLGMKQFSIPKLTMLAE